MRYTVKDIRNNIIYTGTFEEIKDMYKNDIKFFMTNKDAEELKEKINKTLSFDELFNVLGRDKNGLAYGISAEKM